MKIAIGSDRRGFEYKNKLINYLNSKKIEIVDVGTYDNINPVDYPIYGEKVGKLVALKQCDKGIVICATGVGIMISCNKVKGIRCGIAYSDEVVRLMREHNDANVIAFGQNHMTYEQVEKRLDIFLKTDFKGDYHNYRIKQIEDIENEIILQQSPFLMKSKGTS